MADRKAVVKNADMSEDMQQDAIDIATQALEKFNIEKDIAAFIKKEFDKKYNPTWHCIVGKKKLFLIDFQAEILDLTSPMRPSTSSTSTQVKQPFFSSSQVEIAQYQPHLPVIINLCKAISKANQVLLSYNTYISLILNCDKMGKRKSRKTKIMKMAPPKVDKVFDCPFCSHSGVVEIKM